MIPNYICKCYFLLEVKINLDVNLDVLWMFYGLNSGTIAGGHGVNRRTSIGHHSRMSKGCPLNRPVLYGSDIPTCNYCKKKWHTEEDCRYVEVASKQADHFVGLNIDRDRPNKRLYLSFPSFIDKQSSAWLTVILLVFLLTHNLIFFAECHRPQRVMLPTCSKSHFVH